MENTEAAEPAAVGGRECDDKAVNETILVLDAEPIVRTTVTSILSRAGYTVFATGDLLEAMDLTSNLHPDLLLTNMFIPGSTGRNAAERLRELCPGMRALMVAGVPEDCEAPDRVIAHDMDLFPKPFTANQLVDKVQEVLNRDGAEFPPRRPNPPGSSFRNAE